MFGVLGDMGLHFARLARSSLAKGVFTMFTSLWGSGLCSGTVVRLGGRVALDLHAGYACRPVDLKQRMELNSIYLFSKVSVLRRILMST